MQRTGTWIMAPLPPEQAWARWEEEAAAWVGRGRDEIDTPALVIDLDQMEGNITRMAGFFAGRAASLRPHFKTHKCPAVAKLQLRAGAIGITCAKLGEAEALTAAGVATREGPGGEEILIANQVIGPRPAARLAALCRNARVIVAMDSLANADELNAAALAAGAVIDVIAEVDVGMTRAGTRSPEETVRLAQHVSRLPGLRWRGAMGYEGHAVAIQDKEERRAAAAKANAVLLEHVEAVRRAGIPVEIVSGGGTGTYDFTGACPGITEVQSGSYATLDATYKKVCPEFDTALRVLSTVTSRPSPNRIVLDAGVKAITREFGIPQLLGVEGSEVLSLSEEHAKVELRQTGVDLRPGDRVELVPTHGCTTFNLHDRVYGLRKGRVEALWPVAGRGRFA